MTNARILAGRLADLLRVEHGAMADFLVALADFDRRRAWVELGYSSLFYFLHRELGLSKGAAHYRKTAAKLVQRFPEIVEPLRDGRLCITSITHLAKVLTPQNRREMLPRFFQRSKREAMAVAAAIQPATAAPHRDVITAVRPASAAYAVSAPPLSEAAPLGPSAPPLVQPVELNAPAPSVHPKPARRDAAEPLTAELSRLHIAVSRRFLEKLEAARAALSHSHPLATAEDILETGLDLVLERHLKRKGLMQKPRQQTAPQQTAPQQTAPQQTAPERKPSSPAVVLGLVVGQSGMGQPDFGAAALGLQFHAHDALEAMRGLGHPCLLEQTGALQASEPSVVGPARALPCHFRVPEAVHLGVHDQAGRLEPALHVRGIGPRAEHALRRGLELTGEGDGLRHVSPPLPGMRPGHPASRSRTARSPRATGR